MNSVPVSNRFMILITNLYERGSKVILCLHSQLLGRICHGLGNEVQVIDPRHLIYKVKRGSDHDLTPLQSYQGGPATGFTVGITVTQTGLMHLFHFFFFYMVASRKIS